MGKMDSNKCQDVVYSHAKSTESRAEPLRLDRKTAASIFYRLYLNKRSLIFVNWYSTIVKERIHEEDASLTVLLSTIQNTDVLWESDTELQELYRLPRPDTHFQTFDLTKWDPKKEFFKQKKRPCEVDLCVCLWVCVCLDTGG